MIHNSCTGFSDVIGHSATPGYQPTPGLDLHAVRDLDLPRKLEVVAEADPAVTAGKAYLVGWMLERPRPIAMYRLIIGGQELAYLFTLVEGRFERVS